jgi:hypothetical protein
VLECDDYKIELLENYPCCNKSQLERREGECIKTYNKDGYTIVNKKVAGRTRHEYYIDNKEDILKEKLDYNVKNKDKKIKYNKQYYIDNKDKLIEYQKQYKIDNKLKKSKPVQEEILTEEEI